MAKLLYFITEDWYFLSHRLPLARAALKAGMEVVLLTKVSSRGEQIRSEGIRVVPLSLQRSSMNPLKEIKALLRIARIYRAERPDIVHHVAMKPVLYGSVVSLLTGVPAVVNALAGMGSLFVSRAAGDRLVRMIVGRVLALFLVRKKSRLILQNLDDAHMFLKYDLADEARVRIIRGSGVDVRRFCPLPEPSSPLTVVLPGRMLRDKGVVEFVEAAEILAERGYRSRFVLVGDRDPENPSVIPEERLRYWERRGIVEWWGYQEDMPSVYARCHIVCLPSYREGLPKALLEAASCGKPIVATDVPGCREIVLHGVNGYLVPPKNSVALAEALQKLMESRELRESMGARGRELVLEDFSEEKVVSETMSVYKELLGR